MAARLLGYLHLQLRCNIDDAVSGLLLGPVYATQNGVRECGTGREKDRAVLVLVDTVVIVAVLIVLRLPGAVPEDSTRLRP